MWRIFRIQVCLGCVLLDVWLPSVYHRCTYAHVHNWTKFWPKNKKWKKKQKKLLKCVGRKWKELNWVLWCVWRMKIIFLTIKGWEEEKVEEVSQRRVHRIISFSHFFSVLTLKARKESVAFNSLCSPYTSVHCDYWKLLSCREMKVHLGR